MSTLTIDKNAKPIQVLRPTTVRVVSLSGTASAGAAFSNSVRVARIVANTDCFYRVTGAATTSHNYLPANTIEYIHVYDGDSISLITSGGTGTAYVSAMV